MRLPNSVIFSDLAINNQGWLTGRAPKMCWQRELSPDGLCSVQRRSSDKGMIWGFTLAKSSDTGVCDGTGSIAGNDVDPCVDATTWASAESIAPVLGMKPYTRPIVISPRTPRKWKHTIFLLERRGSVVVCVDMTKRTSIFKIFSDHIVYDIIQAIKDSFVAMTIRPWR